MVQALNVRVPAGHGVGLRLAMGDEYVLNGSRCWINAGYYQQQALH
jgi:hypothetical protein